MKINSPVGARVAEQIETVFLGAGKRALVTIDDVGAVIFHRAERDEAFAHQALAGIGKR